MDLNSLLNLLRIDPALLPVNMGLVVVLVAWLRDPVEEFLPQAGPTAALNSFWLKSLNLVLQVFVLCLEFLIAGGAYSLPAVGMILFAALLCAFGADFGYQAVLKAIASSNARASNVAASGDVPVPAPTLASSPASGGAQPGAGPSGPYLPFPGTFPVVPTPSSGAVISTTLANVTDAQSAI